MRIVLLVALVALAGCTDRDIATVSVDFAGEGDNIAAAIEFDPQQFPSAGSYADKDVDHPGYFTVHDLMVAWDGDVGFGYFDGLGFFVESIQGVAGDDCHFWELRIDGESSMEGISTARVVDGTEVGWAYSSFC